MPEVPKIVHHRLRTTTPAQDALLQTHPEADVLTAFAEQALPAPERDGVLQHLALCADCRDVVALALPEVDASVCPVEEKSEVVTKAGAAGQKGDERKSRFAWSHFGWAQLRWATLAAGIAVAVFVVRPALERIGKPHAPVNSAASQAAPAPASQTASGALPENSVVARGAVESKAKNPAESAVKNDESNARTAEKKSRLSSHPAGATPGPEPQSEMQLASNMPAGNSMKMKQGGGVVSKDSVSAGRGVQPGFELRARDALSKSESDKSALGKSTETVEVAAGGAIETVPSAESNERVQSESAALQSAPAIEKAKPALDDKAAKEGPSRTSQIVAAAPMVAGPQAEAMAKRRDEASAMKSAGALQKQAASWIIKDGMLQRSVDGGQTWQAAARADHSLLCYADRGQEIWAGGQAGTLLHSGDNGVTWTRVAVTIKGETLGSAITRIYASAAEIALSTENHETWSSADGGKTWEKK